MFPDWNSLFAQPTHWLGLPGYLRPPPPSESPGSLSPSPFASNGSRADHCQAPFDMPARELDADHEVAPPHSSPLPRDEDVPLRETRSPSTMFEEAISAEDVSTVMTNLAGNHASVFNQPIAHWLNEPNFDTTPVRSTAPEDLIINTPEDLIKVEDTAEAPATTDTMNTAIQGDDYSTTSTGFDDIMTGAATQGGITASEDYNTDTVGVPNTESCGLAKDAISGSENTDAKFNAISAQEITALGDASAIQNLVSSSVSDNITSSSEQLDTQVMAASRNELDREKLAKRAGMHLVTKSQVAEAKIHSSLEARTEPAKFDGNKYTIDMRITSDMPFSINTRTFRVGEHSGRTVMVVEPTPLRTLDFLGFPPEIQNMIYHLLFVRHGCGVYMNPGIDDDDTSVRMRGVWDPKRGYHKAYKDEINIIHGTNLLATCSEIYKAARGVLYGYNDFEFGQTTDLTSFLEPMNKDTAAHIRCLNMGWLLPKDFKEAAKLLPKCVNLQKLHFNLKSMIVPPFKSEHQPEKIAPPFKAILKQMYDQNKVNFFVRVTWASPYPIRNATEEQKVERKAFNKKMKELILAQVMPQPKAIAAGDASATSNNTGTKHKVARKATHNSGRGSA